ncbi:MAG TPA: DNA strand exchange inhibitor protein [Gemmataceae bacterium]|jgi:DNA mismatch repair protein MutS2|nr:DNA strand exchange inhibitor protein [Gemmataceae bacterium]
MDAHTLELLEFDKVRELLAGFAAGSLGRELARAVEPSTDVEAIRRELALVSEMVVALGLGQSPPFGGLHDVRLTVRRASIGAMLSAEQLLEVSETLTCTGAIYRYRMRLDGRCRRLIDMLAPVEDLGPVAKTIGGSLDSRGQVLDMASPELAHIRQQLSELDERVKNTINRLLRDPELRKILRYPNATMSGEHYVLPVAVNYRHKLQGVVHRTSSTGETLFIEPAGVAHLSAERAVLKGDEDREIRRILRRLSGEVSRVAKPLTIALDVMARLDMITAKAKFSRDYAMSAPELNTEGRLWMRLARHPLLEQIFRGGVSKGDEAHPQPRVSLDGREVVPIDIRLGFNFNLLVITGPNTGGKTVSLKTTGLLCLMAQSGLHISAAEGSIVPVLGDIFADIGDEQSLEQSLSTFSSHVSRIAHILRQAGPNTLVLLDELGAGTDPTEGAALGRAILDELDRLGCPAMVTTHLGDLKTYAFSNQRAENGAVEFDVETLRPTYRLHIGQFGMSNALKIARRLKLPRRLLIRARRYLQRKQRKVPELLRLQQLKEDVEKARAEALAKQHEAELRRAEFEQKSAELEREAAEAAALREARGRLRANDRVRVARFDQPGRVVRVDHGKGQALVSVGLGQWEVPLDEIFPLSGP